MKRSSDLNNITQTRAAMLKIISFLEEEYKKHNGKNVSKDDVFAIMKDLIQLVTNYMDMDEKMCLEIIKNRYIPLLKLLIKIDNNNEHKITYLNHLENAYRLGARCDFAYFLIYYEWEKKDKVYEKRYSILHSYVYYLNYMAHHPEFELIIANLPSGYGKTYIVKLYEAWRLGINPRGTYLSLCSNDKVVKGGSHLVMDVIRTERYGNIFPHLSYQTYGKDLFLKETDSEWKLKDCEMLATYYASTVNSNVVGERASLSIHIDDLYADYKEALDENLNMYYYNKYLTVWRKRYIQNKSPQIIISGTMWAPNDFIVKVIEHEKTENKFIKHPKFKYTTISEDGKKVIIQVPALDPVTGKSTCEELRSTMDLYKEKRSLDPYLWECNFQQNPTTPEGLQFDWKNLQTYNENIENIYNCGYAVIDGTRKSGKDFFSMPIYYRYYEKYAMVDCIFTKIATSELIDEIIDKIIKHHVITLVIESNVDGGLKRTLDEKLHGLGVYYCEIIEKYNTVPKEMRIEAEKANIINKLVFPSRNRIEPNTDMARYMQNFTLYNATGRNTNDDAPDSAAMMTSEIIGEKSKPPKVEPMKRFM